MKNTLLPLMLVIGIVLASSAQASTVVLEPQVKPLDPALDRLLLDSHSPFEVRRLNIKGAKELLRSTEGDVWQVLQVQAPACAASKSKSKAMRKNCKALKADCKTAEVFARSQAKHAACSALYTQTTVLLTNDASGKKHVQAAKAAQKKVSKHTHKPRHKAFPKPKRASRKPAASTCDK